MNRSDGTDASSVGLFTRALTAEPQNAEVRQAYGMWLTRQGELVDAVAQFETAATLAPEIPRHAYVYGVALNSSGRGEAAIAVLGDAHARFPRDVDILFALATIHRDRGEPDAALRFAQKLLVLRPGEAAVQELLQQLRVRGTRN